MSRETRESSFDELARGLASGNLTRGKALRLMGAALVGGALASFPGTAWAAKGGGGGGKSSCAKYCNTLYPGDTAAQETCTSQGAKGTGPCFACGGPGKPAPTCTTNETLNTTTCQCEAVTSSCIPFTSCGGADCGRGTCLANASGTGSTCAQLFAGVGGCVPAGSGCEACPPSQVCVVVPTCEGSELGCAVPCPGT